MPPYQILASAGFVDVWDRNLLAFLDPDGFTCCQDDLLDNLVSKHDERIDLIFVANAEFLALAKVTGDNLQIRFGPPFWGSDHGGVFAKILMKRRPFYRRRWR